MIMAVERVTTKEARASLADVIWLAQSAGRRVVITSKGRPAVAVVPLADLETLERATPSTSKGGGG